MHARVSDSAAPKFIGYSQLDTSRGYTQGHRILVSDIIFALANVNFRT